MTTIYTYTPDEPRPHCPECGCGINETPDDPTMVFEAECRDCGFKAIYQLEDE